MLVHMQGSQAYAKALVKCGILMQDEGDAIVEGLEKVRCHLDAWSPPQPVLGLEDCNKCVWPTSVPAGV